MGVNHAGDHNMPSKVNHPVGMVWQIIAVANLFNDAAAHKHAAISDFFACIQRRRAGIHGAEQTGIFEQ